MTAEIALLNSEAVAIAADSAATVRDASGQKIFSSANKIFALSQYYPVGIMIYGNATFMRVPWETIIKSYRAFLGKKKFGNLSQYSEHFIDYLKKEKKFFPREEQERFFGSSVYGYFFAVIRREIENRIEDFVSKKGEIKESDVKTILSEVIKRHYLRFKNEKAVVNDPEAVIKKILSKYSKLLKGIKDNVFEKLPFSNVESRYLNLIAGSIAIKFPKNLTHSGLSGVVITGFGEKDIFPCIESFTIEGVTDNILKYRKESSDRVDLNTSALIIPFAQQEMVFTFMEGVNKEYNNLIIEFISRIIKEYPEKIVGELKTLKHKEREDLKGNLTESGINKLKDIISNLNAYRKKHFWAPIVKVVSFLPKDELASMAEALVNLTCLKKRITMEDETVGGPIDVAVISKGDGLIWMKRKHYFKAELNQQYLFKSYRQHNEKN
jgi:hypothetical protein